METTLKKDEDLKLDKLIDELRGEGFKINKLGVYNAL
jgi:hypothetical protein